MGQGKFIVIFALLLFVIFCCPSKGIMKGQGEITFVELEGGFYGIVTDQGEQLDPSNLPPEFKREGVKVKFKVKLQEAGPSIRMWGKQVEVLDIKELKK